eukprot:gnl/TRDRNA2_/TRDRNA2_185111_c0_seq1.p1 gnl/TRDRNA2_/TRDRNA2_185111_c0~~gnl/TRDRNA2_/TRDRNA2_185111_c0_seq1.p1  ORF type:complete len:647 (-),score=114.48 gnl/TRDRNA2_/TRDRNA2_185111_c0_seq1:81-2021(-)
MCPPGHVDDGCSVPSSAKAGYSGGKSCSSNALEREVNERELQQLRHRFCARLAELVRLTASRLPRDAIRDRAVAELSERTDRRQAAKAAAELAASEASMAVLRLRREELEEVRSLRSPPRAVCEALGLVHALLNPSELTETVEHVSWRTATKLLRHEELMQAISEFSCTGSLLAIPAVRSVLEILSATAEPGPQPRGPPAMSARGSAPPLSARGRAPMSARGYSAAGAAVSRLLSAAPVRQADATPRYGSIVCGRQESEPRPEVESVGLLTLLRGTSGPGLVEISSVSRPVGLLLDWALSQLRSLQRRLPLKAADAEAERALCRERDEASALASKFAAPEVEVAEEVCGLSRQMKAWEEKIVAGDDDEADGQAGFTAELLEAALVRFSRGGALLSSLNVRPVTGVVEVLRRQPNLRLRVEGYVADGEPVDLAQKRADAVVRYLGSQGIAESRLEAAGVPGASESCVRFAVAQGLRLPPGVLRFAACSDSLGPDAVPALEGVARSLRDCPLLRICVEGHTDSAPMWLGNAALSESRADRVAKCLEELGVPAKQLEACGHSDRMPQASNKEPEGRAANRRVELHVSEGETVARVRTCGQAPLVERTPALLLQLAMLAAGGPCLRLAGASKRAATEVLVAWGVTWAREL